jgi:hypothetical protein
VIATDSQNVATLCPDGIKIIGAGTQNTRLVLRETASSAQQIFGALNLEVSDVVIRDLTLDCNNAVHGSGGSAPNNDVCGIRIGDNNNGGDQSYRVKVQNVRVIGATLHGIILSHTSDLLVEGCSVEGYVGFGIIAFRGCSNIRFINNYITTTVAASAAIIADSRSTVSTTPEPGSEIVITGNHIDGNDVMTTGINVPDSYATMISGNTILDCTVVGINIDENESGSVPEQAAQYTNVVGNVIRGQSNTGATSAAILCVGQYVNIVSNIISDAAASGILLFDDVIASVIPDHVNVLGNVIENAAQSNGAAIQVTDGNNISIAENHIADTDRYGIRILPVTNVSGVRIAGNTIRGTGFHGIEVVTSGGTASNIQIKGNSVSQVDTTATGSQAGIRLQESSGDISDITISDNDVFDEANASIGVHITGAGVTGIRLSSNRCSVTTGLTSSATNADIVERFGNSFDRRMVWGSAAPTGGTWAIGDQVINTAPAAAGNIGWVCTTGGTPGTWKTFGAIAA